MIADIHPSWRNILEEESGKPYFAALMTFIENAYSSSVVFPPRPKIFEAFNRTPFDDVKVVILGQDPYHEPGQAQGLSFYVPENVKPPPSLRNIAKELGKMPDLMSWADQGVLLLNATLTVEAHKAGSHQKKGWETPRLRRWPKDAKTLSLFFGALMPRKKENSSTDHATSSSNPPTRRRFRRTGAFSVRGRLNAPTNILHKIRCAPLSGRIPGTKSSVLPSQTGRIKLKRVRPERDLNLSRNS